MTLLKIKKNEKKLIWCPGCNLIHKMDKRWKVSGTIKKPTIHPKIQSTTLDFRSQLKINCKVEVKDGMLHYDEEVTNHQYRGQSIPMQPLPEIEGL